MSVYRVPFQVDSDVSDMEWLRRIMGFATSTANIRIYIIQDREGIVRHSLAMSHKDYPQVNSFRIVSDYKTAVRIAATFLGYAAQHYKQEISNEHITTFDEEFNCPNEDKLKWFETCGFFNVIHRHKIEVK